MTESIGHAALPDLPSGWVWTTFEATCKPVSDGGRKLPQKLYLSQGHYPIIDQGEAFIGGYTDDSKMVFNGALPVIAFGDHTRRFKLVEHPFAVGADGIKLIGPTAAWHPKCLWLFLQCVQFEDRGYSRHFQFLRKTFLPLPPLNEQRRIVEEYEEVSSVADAGIAALEGVKKKLPYYRAAVLKAAIQGKLSEEWRDKNALSESASELLNRILVERRKRWEGEQLQSFDSVGKEPPKNWKAKYREPLAPDAVNLPALPNRWCWATVDQLSASDPNAITDGPFGSNLKTSHYTADGMRVIRLQNIKDGVFADEKAHISREHFSRLEKHKINAGDIVFAALGDSPPRCCIIPESVGPAIVKADCIRFKPHPSLLVKCLMYFLNSAPTRARLKVLVHGVGRPRMNLAETKAIVIPLPPKDEQEVIVDTIDDQLSVVDHLASEVKVKLDKVGRVRQAVLRCAFNGLLVPQDPNDEPASELLKHIAAESEKRVWESRAAKSAGKNGFSKHGTAKVGA